MVASKFEYIKIVDLDVEKTRPSKTASGLRYMYLKLSSNPPREWILQFNESRRFPRHTMWRNAWVEGSYIVVDCAPEEIEEYHFADLKEDVFNANQRYSAHVGFLEKENERKKAEEEKYRIRENDRLNRVKSNLNFD